MALENSIAAMAHPKAGKREVKEFGKIFDNTSRLPTQN